ncbi:MAG: DUF11 domain-containing protein [Solirubrobacterales bacterium]|nr:DUF11 domain-containing protein [Solirubrobacterales bacterium]
MRNHGRRLLPAAAIGLIASLATAAPALADHPLRGSEIVCKPAVGKFLRVGDDLACTLTVRNVEPMFVDDVTATIDIPADMSYDPAAPDNEETIPDPPLPPATFSYGTSKLGDFAPGDVRTVKFRLKVAPSATPGEAIQPEGQVHAPGYADLPVTSNVVNITPPVADISPSTVVCADLNAGRFLPGDLFECKINLENLTGREDATGVQVQASIPPLSSYVLGDASTNNFLFAVWRAEKVPTGIPSGAGPLAPLTYRMRLDPNAPGGTAVVSIVNVNYTNSITGLFAVHTLQSNGLVTDPGPAILTSSNLTCVDLSPATAVLPGDRVRCTLTVANAPGRETAEDVNAVAPVPDGVVHDVGGTSVDADGVRFDTSVLGTLPSPSSKVLEYRLRVPDDARVGLTFQPTAQIVGRSTPSGVALSHALKAEQFVVGRPPSPATPAPVAAASTPAATPPKKDSRICGSRRVVVVNVKPPKGKRWKSVSFTWKGAKKATKGKKSKGSRGKRGYFTGRLVFQGLPKGQLTVTITGRTTKGKTVKRTRKYKLCTAKGK